MVTIYWTFGEEESGFIAIEREAENNCIAGAIGLIEDCAFSLVDPYPLRMKTVFIEGNYGDVSKTLGLVRVFENPEDA